MRAIADAEARALERAAWLALAVRTTVWSRDPLTLDDLLGRRAARGGITRDQHVAAWRELWRAAGGDAHVEEFWGPEGH